MVRQTVFGADSVGIRTPEVEAWVTQEGGQLAPVTFRLGDRNIQPFHIAPWHDEPGIEPPIIDVLRGDFFCLPFGGNSEPYQGEQHPVHGEPANRQWDLQESDGQTLRMRLDLTIRPGRIEKTIALQPGHAAVYSRHTVANMSGPMPLGHHAMLRFDTEGLIATSPFGFGQVFPGEFESPIIGGYTSFRRGAQFDRLDSVPKADGSIADLTRYPAREGFEDLAMIYSTLGSSFAWTAVTFPDEGYVWFSLKDARVLSGTVLWHSNGGRHYAPWSGRHRRVLGLEEVTANMHWGLAGSAGDSDARKAGYRTFHEMNPNTPLVVNTIMGVAKIPAGFDHVDKIEPGDGHVVIVSRSGQRVVASVDVDWLGI